MSDRERFHRALHYESYILNIASQHGVECATVEAELMIDGASNAMTHIVGPRTSAEFAMRLGDRIVNNFDLTAVGKVEEKREEKVEPIKRVNGIGLEVVFFILWFFFGFVIGLTARFF